MSMKKDRSRRRSGTERLEVDIFVGENVSVAQARMAELTGIGEAKRVPGDVWSGQVGRDLAVGRALQDVADQLLERHRHA
jgi:Domain of unknown function (DUF1876).